MKRACPATVVIREPIGRAWHDQPVWLALPAPAPWAAVDAASGEELPAQLCTPADDAGVPEAPRLCVRVSLVPDQVLTLRLRRRRRPSRLANPFTVTEAAGTAWEIGNGVVAARIPASMTFGPGPVPGPVMALQAGVAGAWHGCGTWGPATAAGRIETRILDSGPLFARWQTRYLVGGMELAAYDVRLWAGEDALIVRDRTRADAGLEFRFELAGDDAPDEWFVLGGGEQATVVRGPLTSAPPAKGVPRPGELVHIDFHSGHHQMSYSWIGFLRAGAPAIGVCELNGGHWQIPGRQRIRARRTSGGVALAWPVNGGGKEFALVCGDAAAYAPAAGLSRFCHLRRRHSDLPLERVRHWVTAWTRPPASAPRLYPRGTAERWREQLAAWPELAAAYRGLLPLLDAGRVPIGALLPLYLTTGEARVRDALLAAVTQALDTGIAHAVDNGYLRLIIFDGRTLKVALEALDILRWRGELAPEAEQRFARQAAFLAYCFHDPNFWPWDSQFRDRSDPRGHGDDYWEDIGDSICPPNFATEYWTSFLLTGLAFPEHPAAERWIADGAELFARQLDQHFFESGGYCESLNYHAHEAVMLTQAAVALLAAGGRDFLAHPRFRANYEFLTRMTTPPAHLTDAGRDLATAPTAMNPPADGRAVLLTCWGNSGHDCSGYLVPQTVAVAAGLYAERDPAFAARLMTAWRRSPQEFCTHYSGFNLIVFGRPDLAEVDPGRTSELVEGLGANLRARVGTPREIYGWVKAGLATHHNCRDEGGLVLYAYGAPLIGDFGYHTRHEGRHESGYDTWKHACVTFGGRDTSGYLGCERVLPPESWTSTADADLLVVCAPQDYVIPDGHHYLDSVRCTPRIEHRRFLLFVKDPGYFVLHDHIPVSGRPSTWWCHALADAVDLREGGARFRGRWGVDLDVQWLLPQPARVEAGVYSVQRHVRVDQPGAGDYLAVLTPVPAGAAVPRAAWDPAARTLTVACGEAAADCIRLEPCGLCGAGVPSGARVALWRGGRLLLAERM